MATRLARNVHVEHAVDAALSYIDRLIGGEKLAALPASPIRQIADAQLQQGASVKVASLFFVFYAMQDKAWNRDSLPKGIRGKYGDKRLATGLGLRSITLHGAITAFGENLGWKGNVDAVRLQSDKARFAKFSAAIAGMSQEQLGSLAAYLAFRFADSRQVVAALPPVSDDVLTFARARQLFYALLTIPSEGNIQQFLIASLLFIHRSRYGYEVRTHHVHASDKFDGTAGDIEEFFRGDLHRAYEVTVRPDWKNRVGDFKAKMDAFGLKKYTIIASNVGSDEDLAEPAEMIRFLEPFGRDIAVVDIHDFVNVFAMELTAEELRRAVNQTYSYLTTPSLCGRPDVIARFSTAVSRWLDSVSPDA